MSFFWPPICWRNCCIHFFVVHGSRISPSQNGVTNFLKLQQLTCFFSPTKGAPFFFHLGTPDMFFFGSPCLRSLVFFAKPFRRHHINFFRRLLTLRGFFSHSSTSQLKCRERGVDMEMNCVDCVRLHLGLQQRKGHLMSG